jgi:hypothetical protein
MGQHYHKSSTRIIAWDNTVQKMEGKKVYLQNGLYWGKPQVVHLRWKCTGTPIAVNKLNYPRPLAYRVKMRGEWHRQCNCIVLITVQSAENCVMSELEVKSSFIDLFGVDSSQSQDDPPTPPPQHRKRKLEERHEVDNMNDSNDEDRSGGKQGGGYGGSGRGGGKCKSAF